MSQKNRGFGRCLCLRPVLIGHPCLRPAIARPCKLRPWQRWHQPWHPCTICLRRTPTKCSSEQSKESDFGKFWKLGRIHVIEKALGKGIGRCHQRCLNFTPHQGIVCCQDITKRKDGDTSLARLASFPNFDKWFTISESCFQKRRPFHCMSFFLRQKRGGKGPIWQGGVLDAFRARRGQMSRGCFFRPVDVQVGLPWSLEPWWVSRSTWRKKVLRRRELSSSLVQNWCSKVVSKKNHPKTIQKILKWIMFCCSQIAGPSNGQASEVVAWTQVLAFYLTPEVGPLNKTNINQNTPKKHSLDASSINKPISTWTEVKFCFINLAPPRCCHLKASPLMGSLGDATPRPWSWAAWETQTEPVSGDAPSKNVEKDTTNINKPTCQCPGVTHILTLVVDMQMKKVLHCWHPHAQNVEESASLLTSTCSKCWRKYFIVDIHMLNMLKKVLHCWHPHAQSFEKSTSLLASTCSKRLKNVLHCWHPHAQHVEESTSLLTSTCSKCRRKYFIVDIHMLKM